MSKKKDYIEKAEDSIEEIKEIVEDRVDEKRRFTPGPLLLSFLLGAAALMIVLLFMGKMPNPFDPEDDDTSGRLIGESIREISELATLEYDYTFVGRFKKSRELDFAFVDVDIPFTEKKFIASFNGTIKYGINLKKLAEPKINNNKKTITFTMPEINLISHEIDLNSFYPWHEENNLFHPIKPSDTVKFQKQNKKRAEKQAIERGVVEKVQTYTTTVVTSFVHSIFPEYKDYKVICNYPEQKTINRVSDEVE